MVYSAQYTNMFILREHEAFTRFLAGIKDKTVRARIRTRLERMELGLFGHVEPVGGGVWEAKIDFGAGWRVYYMLIDNQIILLLGGGTKHGQQADIRMAKERARAFKK